MKKVPVMDRSPHLGQTLHETKENKKEKLVKQFLRKWKFYLLKRDRFWLFGRIYLKRSEMVYSNKFTLICYGPSVSLVGILLS